MQTISADHDAPAAPSVGLAARRERAWGVVGATLGTIFGVGSAAIAIFVEGADLRSSGLYPPFFANPRFLVYDAFLMASGLTGLGFLAAALAFARAGRYPRTDAFGAGLVGTILTALAGTLAFLRLVAVIRGL